jgi:serine/threonine-protein kinase
MGEVFIGEDEAGEIYAIKVLGPELARDPEVVARFVMERNPLLRLRGPHLVPVHDLVLEGDALAIVMEMVPGGDLHHLMFRGPVPPAEVARLGAGIARGLADVHRTGEAHGDLKPKNILVDYRENPASPRLTDVAMAKLTPGGAVGLAGSAPYLAPEVWRGDPPTVASDLYALGAVLYQMCCGVPPFVGEPAAVRDLHLMSAPGRPDGIPDSLWGVISDLMAHEPGRRPGPAAEIATRLDGLVLLLGSTPPAPGLTAPPPPAAPAAASPAPAAEKSWTETWADRTAGTPALAPPADDAPTTVLPPAAAAAAADTPTAVIPPVAITPVAAADAPTAVFPPTAAPPPGAVPAAAGAGAAVPPAGTPPGGPAGPVAVAGQPWPIPRTARRRGGVIAAAVVVALLIGAGVWAVSRDDEGPTDLTTEPPVLPAVTETPSPEVTPTETPSETPAATETPSVAPACLPLRLTSDGSLERTVRRGEDTDQCRVDVRMMQSALGVQPVDGYFGPRTESAVRRHQFGRCPSYPSPGVIDRWTWDSVIRKRTAQCPGVVVVPPPPAQTATPTPTPTPTPMPVDTGSPSPSPSASESASPSPSSSALPTPDPEAGEQSNPEAGEQPNPDPQQDQPAE